MSLRIIHTSDWHLGQHFFGKSRAVEHGSFLSWLRDQVEQYQVDAVIVAGDIFDTGTPPSYARELYNRFVVALQSTGCQLVVLGGNHDSVATLNESRELLSRLNTRVIPGVMADPNQQVFPLRNRHDEPAAVLCAIPFIRPRDLLISQAGQSGDDKRQALQAAIAAHYQDLYQRAAQLRDELAVSVPIIATGHLTTVGASTTESVRDLYIGTLDAFPAQAFPPADYIALGHIHKHQRIGGTEHIRYSGAPLALSFDECSQTKCVLMADFNEGRLVAVEQLPVPVFQPLKVIRGDLKAIEAELTELAGQYTADRPVWLDIEVSTQDFLSDLQRRIQSLTEGLPVEVLLLRRERSGQQAVVRREATETLAELTVDQVFERRLALLECDDPAEQARFQRLRRNFREVVEEIRSGQAADVANDSDPVTGKGASAL